MKVQAEITYNVNEEPASFIPINTISCRSVYLWFNQRGILDGDSPWYTQERLSTVLEQPAAAAPSFIEVWTNNTAAHCPSPPLSPDDNWQESYKILRQKNYSVEYHPESKLLRFIWLQTGATLAQNKILASVLAAVEEYGQIFPKLPVIQNAGF